MGYFRHVVAASLPVEAVSLALDDNRAALRILTSLKEHLPDWMVKGDALKLLTTERLGKAFVSLDEVDCYYELDGRFWGVMAEVILDKREPEFQRIWMPGVHFVFYLDPSRGLKIDVKGALSGVMRRNTAELIRHMGGIWCFDLWVRNLDDPLTECSRSITTAPTTRLFTNVENLGEEYSAEDVMAGGCSKWLTLSYRLTPDAASVCPDGAMDYTFEVLDGKTGEVARDVSWDGWRIEAIDGYAPHKRVKVVNGVGRFRVVALGLEQGESMRVKVQSCFNPSLIESTVQIR